ncbi:MAG: hypothetical protein ACRCYS_11555 [Beijerinckiaceae bacterium]
MSDNIESNVAMILGEVRGQLREIIHTMNAERSKLESVAVTLSKLDGVPAKLVSIENRLTALEAERNRRDGAMGIVAALLKSPLIGWMVGVIATGWALFEGMKP